jgi:two-component system cell cycle sensor histidine kinase/response regulator CckA
MKILAIDDNRDNLIVLKAVISDGVPEVDLLAALDGAAGLELAAAEDPDVILLDIVMPAMDGYEVCRILKRDERLRIIPVVFLTAVRSDRESRIRALEAGAEGFLSKPIDELELRATLHSMAKIKEANRRERLEKERLAALVSERTRELNQEVAELNRAQQELSRREERWRTVLGTAMDGFCALDRGGRVFEVNDAACRITGYTRDELLEMNIGEVEAAESAEEAQAHMGRIAAAGSERFETRFRRRDGAIIDVQVSARYSPRYEMLFAFLRDVTARRRAEEALRASEDRYRRTVETAEEGIWTIDPGGSISFANRRMAKMLGYSVEEMMGLPLSSFVAEEFQESAQHKLEQRQDVSERFEFTFRRRSGEPLHVLVAACPMQDGEGRHLGSLGMVTDITDLKRREEEHEAIIDLLRLLNSDTDLHELIRDVTTLLREWSGCEAVGVRLRDGGDFPYFETKGLPAKFVELESRLCAIDLDGQLKRDSRGNPVLECMCGNVLCGRFDPRKPFFTTQGSFWTNSTSRLLSSTIETDRLSRTRNRCHGEGYESVALVPLRSRNRTLGLLQFNDRREGRFSPGRVELLERVAANLAMALEQRLMQRSLSESEEKYRLLFQNMTQGAFRRQADGALVDANPAALRMFGLTREEFLGRTSENVEWDVICEDGQPLPGQQHPSMVALATGKPVLGQVVGVRSQQSGERVWVEINAIPEFRNGEKRPYQVMVTLHDVTERRRAEQELRESRGLLKAVVEGTSDAIYVKDTQGRYLLLNSAGEEFVGKSVSEVVGKDDTFLFPPEEARQVMGRDRAVMDSGVTRTYEEVVTTTRGAGTTFLTTKGPLKNATGQIVGLFGVARDISDRRRAEEEVRLSRQRLALHVEQTPLAAIEFDVTGRVTAWNPAACQVFGYSREEALGRGWHFIVPEPVRSSQDGVWEALVRRTDGSRSTNANLTKDGRTIWCEWFSTPLVDAAGHTVGLATLVMDVTERRRAEDALRDSERKYRIVADNTYDWEFWIDPQGNFLYCSPSCRRITGHDSAEFLGDPSLMERLVHPEDREIVAEHRREANRGDCSSEEIEFRIVRPDGSERWIAHVCQPMTGETGCFLGLRGSNRDITGRKAVELRLQERESELAAAQAIAHLGSWTWNVKTDEAHWSDETFRIFGVPRGPLERHQKSFVAMVHPEDQASVHQALTGALEGVAPYDLDYRVLRPDGTERLIHARAEIVRDNDGQPLVMRGSVHDVTEYRQVEQALREAARFNRQVIDSARDGVVVHGRDLRYEVWNRYMEELTGVAAKDVLGRHPQELFPFLAEAGVIESIHDVLANGTTAAIDFPFSTSARHRRWVSLITAPLRDQSGGIVGAIAVVRDITERVRIERERAISAAMYRAFLMDSGDKTYPAALDVLLEAFDSKFGVFGYIDRHGDLVCPSMTREIWEQCGVRDKAAVFKKETWGSGIWGNALRSGKAAFADAPFKVPPGHLPIDNCLAAPILAGDAAIGLLMVANKSGGYAESDKDLLVAVASSIAPVLQARLAQELAEDEKERLSAQLAQAQKMESIGRLAGGVAHDFNNLLTVINGYSKMLADGFQESDPAREMAMEIHRAGERAADLTRQLLAFSRQQPAQPRPVKLNEIVAQATRMLERLLGENIRLGARLASDLSLVWIDPGQVHQILMNLAVNAKDAMPGGGSLTIETADEETIPEDAQSRAGAGVPAGPYVRLSVIDAGAGMDAHTQRHLFEPFFTTKEIGKGTGLGLATVYGIVRQYEGSIVVKSELGKGSAFHVYLPPFKPSIDELPDSCPAHASGPITGSETILIVEDQTEVRKFAASVLRDCGYAVLEAAGGEDALRLTAARANPVSLLVADVVMPGMSGVELASRLQTEYPELGVIYISGYSESVLTQGGMIGGEVHYLTKPFSSEDLALKVREVLDARPARRKLLVVDDEAGVRDYFKEVLARAGYNVTAAADGKQALELVRRNRYDLVLMDLVMPEQEGIETIRMLRSEKPEIRLIAVSGAFQGGFLKVAEALGAKTSLLKPVDPAMLLNVVRKVLAEH